MGTVMEIILDQVIRDVISIFAMNQLHDLSISLTFVPHYLLFIAL